MDPTEILSAIVQNFAKLLPFCTVHEYQQAVRWTFGKASPSIGRGFYWYLYLAQSIDVFDTSISFVDFMPQTIITPQSGLWGLRGSLTYKITDAREVAVTLGYKDSASIIRGRGRGLVASEVIAYDKENGVKHLALCKENIEEKVLTALKKMTTPWGIDSINFDIGDFGPTRSMYLRGVNDDYPDLGSFRTSVNTL